MVTASGMLQNGSEDELLRLESLNLEAHTALETATLMNATGPGIIQEITNYNASATQVRIHKI